MSSKFPWISNILKPWTRRKSDKAKRRPFRHLEARPNVEQLEVRDLMAGTLSLSGGVLTLADSAAPTITVALASNNYTITDNQGIAGSITGWTISGNTATETDGGAGSITQLAFNTTGATFGTSTTGIAAGAASIAITDAGNVTIGGAVASTGTATTGGINIAAAGSIADNSTINSAAATITIAADTAGTGTAGFAQAQTGATITSTNAGVNAVSITVNTTSGGTGNASIRTIADSGTLTINANGGSILYAGTDTLTAQDMGIIGSDNAGSGPTGEVGALTYSFTTTGSTSSIGTAARPIQTTCLSGGAATLSTGSGGAYFIDWGNPLTLNGASATGAGNVYVVTANASGHNLTVAGNVTTGSGNIILAADDNFVINSGVMIGGTGFSGTVYLGANRDQGNTGTLTDGGTIITSNTSVYNNTGTPGTSSSGAVLLEDYSVTGTHAGNLTLGNITVGNGGTITATTAPTLGIYDATTAGVGSADIIDGSTSVVLNAGANGAVNLIAAEESGATSTAGIGTSATPIRVSAGTVTITNTTGTTTVAENSDYVTDLIAGSFSAVNTGSVAGTINLTDSSDVLTIGGATSTAGGGAINLTGAGGIAVNAALGSSTTGAISATATTGSLTTSSTIATNNAAVNLTGAAGSITIGGTVTSGTAAINLNGSTGVVLNGGVTVGSTTNGAIAITGPLSGSGNIQMGAAGLTLNQSAGSTYSGAISGASATDAVTYAGSGALTLAGTSNYPGATNINAGTLNVTGTLSATSGVNVAGNGALTGSGTIDSPVTDSGIVAPGGGSGGTAILTVAALSFSGSGAFTADVNGTTAGTDYDQINVSGTGNVNLNGGILNINPGTGLTTGETFTLVSDAGETISGQFTCGDALLVGSDYFSIAYGTNTVVATLTIVTPPVVTVSGNQVGYTSASGGTSDVTVSETSDTYTIADNGATINLTPAATAAGWSTNADGSVSGPTSYTSGTNTVTITSLLLDLTNNTNAIAGINADSASVSIVGSGPLAVNGDISGGAASVAISGFSSVDFESNVTASGAVSVSGASSITGDSAGATGALTGSTVSFTGTGALAVNDTLSVTGNLAISGYSSVDFEGNSTATDTVSATGAFTVSGTSAVSDGISGTPVNLSAANVAVTGSGSGTVDFEGNLTATGNIAVSAYANITDGAAGDASTLTTGSSATLSLTATTGIGTSANPVLTAAPTISASAGAGGVFVSQQTGSASVTASAAGAGNVSLADADSTATLTIGGAVSTASGNIAITAAGAIIDNANINAGSGTIAISADTAGVISSAVTPTDAFTQAITGATITSTNTGASTVSITVNTASNGTGNASIRTIADSGTLTITANGGSILYAGTDALTAGQAALTTLAPGITGPAGSLGNGGSAPTGSVNALHYLLSTSSTGTGSIGTAARPINTSTPASNTELLSAGSGGIYFVDWGNPLTLNEATATGAGNVEVVAANAGGHNLVVAGNVSTGSGNIVLAADDDFAINSGVTVGGTGFSGDVYLACNRDTGNGENLTVSGTVSTSNTSASAVVIEGFHAAGNGTDSGVVVVNNVTVGNGGTITVSTVPASLATGQGSIVASSSSSVLNAGPLGTVDFIATTMAGNATYTTAVGTAATPITVTAGNVIVTANSGTSGTLSVQADSVYVTDTIAGNFAATTSSGSINLTDSGGTLTVNGAMSTGNTSAINLTSTAASGGVIVSAPLGSTTTGAIAINAGTNGVQFTSADTFYSNDPVTVTAGTAAEITSTGNVTLNGGALSSASGIQVDHLGTLCGAGAVSTGSNQLTVDGTLSPSVLAAGLNTDLTLNSDATMQVTLDGTGAGQFSQVNVTGSVTLTNAALVITVGGALSAGDQFELISNDGTDPVSGTFGSVSLPLGYTYTINYASSDAGGDGNDVVLTITGVPVSDTFDVAGNTGTFSAGPGVNNSLSMTESGGVYTLNDTAEPINLTSGAVAAGWTNTNANTVTGPESYLSGGNTVNLTSLIFNTVDGNDSFSSLTADAASITVNGDGNLAIDGPVTTSSNVTFENYASVDFEGNVTATGSIGFSGVTTITDGAAGTTGTLTAATLTLTAANGIGTSSLPLLTAGANVTVNSGSADAFVQQTTGSVNFTATATAFTNINLSDSDSTGALTVGGATSSASGNITVSAAGDLTVGAAITSSGGVITLNAGGSLSDNSAINAGPGGSINLNDTGASGTLTIGATLTTTGGTITTSSAGATADNATINAGSGTISISADAAGTGAAGTADFTEASSGVTITSTNAGNAISITVNTDSGGTANANIRTIAATSGTLTINTNGGSMLYAGTDTLDIQQSALSTLAPGITGPAASGTGQGGAASAPSGDVNALNYVLSASGSGSIGTAARPINTSSPVSNTENLNAGDGGIYFVDWGNPMTLTGATATGPGGVEVVAANASGHNLTVTGNVTTGSGNIVLAADDNFVIDSNVTIGGGSFSGDVYLASNRDTGNTDTLTESGTVSTLSTSASAAVLEGFHAAGNGTNAGVITVNNITVGDGGTITVSGVPTVLATGQSSIVAASSSSDLYAGPDGTVQFIATTMAGNATYSSAVGLAGTPMMVTAGNVIITANVGVASGDSSNADSVFVTDTIAGNFTATTGSTAPSGSINLTDSGGTLTINGATNTGSTAAAGAINLTSTVAGGVIVSAPLGSTTSGPIAINAGTNAVQFTTPQTFYSNDPVTITSGTPAELTSTSTVILSAAAVLNSSAGVQVDNGATLTGTGTVNTGSNPLTVDGTLAPTVTTAGLNTNSLTLQSDATMQVTLGGAGQYVNATGTVTLDSPTLVINVAGAVALGSTFTIIDNDGTGPVLGAGFSNTTFTAANLAGYAFTVSYTGGDGNDVVLTVTSVPSYDLFDVTGATGSFVSAPSINNHLTVTETAGVYTIADTGDTITLTSNAVAAGWSNPIVDGVTDDNEVTGPASYMSGGNTINLTTLNFNTADGADVISSLAAGAANIGLSGFGSLSIDGSVATTGNVNFFGYTAVDFEGNVTASGNIAFAGVGAITDGGADTLTGAAMALAASNGIGSAANPVLTQAAGLITVTPSTSNAYVTQTIGSVSFAGSATGAGSLNLADTDPSGTVTIASALTTVNGNVSISAAGALAVNANINAGNGAITLSADTAGSGAAGYTQATTAKLTTTNATANAVNIVVNTASGGTGTADVGNALVGNTSGGYYNVNANAGTIVWNESTAQARGTSGVPTNVINAYGFSFADTGAGGVGTAAIPIQLTGPIENDPLSASAGTGGIYATDFGTEDLQLNQAIATGAGNINIETNNAGGHDMFINGTVSTGSGSITLYADDDLILNGVAALPYDGATIGAQANALVGGSGFSGTVDIESNLDTANADPVIMDAGSAIYTTNANANAVLIESYSAASGIGAQNTPAGGVQVGNVTVGAGGTITVNAAAGSAAARQGNIVQLPGTLLDTSGGSGTVYGSVVLLARGDDTSGDGNASAAAATGNIGMGGTIANPALFPILVKAATVTATTTGTNLADSGNIVISDNVPASFTAVTSGNATGFIVLTTTNDAALTIGGATSTGGGSITLNSAGGIVLNATLGNSATGAITINGALTGSGGIQLGTGGLTLAQSTNSTYAGVISGSATDTVTYAGGGVLTLTNTSAYTGPTAVTAGTLNVTGSLSATSGVTVSGTGLLAGSGTIDAAVTDNGVVSPGGGNGGTASLTVGGLSIGTGAFTADIDGTTAGTGYDQLNVTGSVAASLAGTLNVFVTPGATLTIGSQFTILSDASGISGQFANAAGGASIAAVNNPNYIFTVAYSGTAVVLTLADIYTSPEIDVLNGNEVVYTTPTAMNSILSVSTNTVNNTFTIQDTGATTITLSTAAQGLGWVVSGNTATGPTEASLLLGLNEGSDSITALNAGSANVSIVGSGSLTVSGAAATTGSMGISQFSTVSADAAISAAAGLTISATSLDGSGSLSSSGGNVVAVSPNLTVGSGLTFSAVGGVTFNAEGAAMTVGTETVTAGALVIDNASTLSLNGVVTDNASSITISNVTDIAAGSSENLVTPTLNLSSANSIGTAANNLVSAAANVTASTGNGGVYITQDGSASYAVTTSMGGNVSITDPNAADTTTIAGSIVTGLGGNILLSAAGAITDSSNLNAGFGTITINANTAGIGNAGFSETAGLIQSANWGNAVAITINTPTGGTGNASIDNINASGGAINIASFGGSIVYAGSNTLTAYQLGMVGDGGSAPSRVLSAASYTFTTTNTDGAAESVGSASRPLQLNSPATAKASAVAGGGGVYLVDWGTVGSATLTLAGASATGNGGVLVVSANASGHNLTITGPVTAVAGNIFLAADDNFIDSAPIGGSNFSGTVYMAGNRDTGNTGTLTMTAGATFGTSGSITTSNTSVYNPATQTPGAVLLEDYSASGTAAGDLTLGNITVGVGGSITATTIPTLGLYNPAVSAGAADIVAGSANVVLTAPGGTVNLIAAPGRSTSAGAGIGSSSTPIVVSAANVVISNSTATTVSNDSVYVTDLVSGTFSAVASGSAAGTINLADSGGTLTIGGITNTLGGGNINLTDLVGNIIVDAPLGSAASGAITINAGTNNVLFGVSPQTFYSNDPVAITAGTAAEIGANVAVTLSSGSWTAANGTQVDSGASLAGTGTVASAVTVAGGGTVSPGAPVGTLNVNSLALNSTSNVDVTLDSATPGDYSQLNYTTSASLDGANLQVFANGNLNIGDTFTIVSTSAGTLTGTFAAGSTITAANNPFYIFSISYAGNDVTLTVTQVPTGDVVDVVGNAVNFYTLGGVANNLSVSLANNAYTLTDTAEPIELSGNAVAAGWTHVIVGGNPDLNEVTGPTTYTDSSSNTVTLSNFNFSTQDAADTVTGMNLGAANVSLNGSGTLDFEGNVTTTGNITLSGYTSITDGAAGTAGTLTGAALSMTGPNGIGTSADPLLTAATSDIASATTGAVYITQTGAGTVNVTAGGAISVADTSGTLTVAATTTDTTASDAVTLASADSLVLDGNVNAGSAHIIISADTDGLAASGTASYNQAGYSLITANTDDRLYGLPTDAAIITVNTPSAGLGDVIIGMGSIGSNSGGEITVNSNGGSILWSNDPVYAAFTASQTGLANGGSNIQTLKANDYVLESLSTGAGSIGTNARPLQFDAYAPAKGLNDADMSLTAGSGGIYVTEWGNAANDAITLDSATATGAGNIRVVSANAGAHNMYVDGPVVTGTGSIALYSDDDLILTTSSLTSTPAEIGGTDLIGETFSGTVDLQANRDLGNEQILDMGPGTSIVTTSTSATAVSLQANSSTGSTDSPGDPLIPTGGVVLTSITTGGGGISVAANNAGGSGGSSAPAGLIVQRSGGVLQGGTVTLISDAAGTDVLSGQFNSILTTPAASSASYAAGGSAIDLSAASLSVTEGSGFTTPTVANAQFDILVNGTGQPIAAPFSNYAEGAIITVGSDNYALTYHGGVSGQDVVLTYLNPVIATTTLPNWTVGRPYNQTVTADGGTAPYSYALTAGSLPTGLSLNPSTGAITGTPTTTTGSPFDFTITVTDANGSTGSQAYSVTINPAPAITTTSLPSGTVGHAYNQTINETGGTGPITFAVSAGSLPSGLSLNAGTGAITGTPTTATGSPFHFTITATDSVGATASQGYSVTINSAPVITTTTLPDWTVGLAYNQTITEAGGAGTITFSVSAGALPSGLSLNASTGAITGTPTDSVDSPFSFTITATDAEGDTGSQAYTVTINPAVSITTTSLPSGTVGQAYNQTVSATGGTGTLTFSVSAGSLPPGLSLDDGSGAITGTPTDSADSPFSFTITATDSVGATASQAYTVSITSSSTPITVVSKTVNGDLLNVTSSISSAVENAGSTTVQITTSSADGLYVGELVSITGVGAVEFNGTYTVASVIDATDFTYVDTNFDASSPGSISDGGSAVNALGGAQRSMVDSITYVFNQAVTLNSGAISMDVNSGYTGTAGSVPDTISYNTIDDGHTWLVTFSGSNVTGNSIADGVYDITLNAGAVSADVGSGTLASSQTDTFFRLFGDSNGDASVTSRPDVQRFASAFGTSSTSAAYLAYFDYNADGSITSRPDVQNFATRFGTSLTGFTPTI